MEMTANTLTGKLEWVNNPQLEADNLMWKDEVVETLQQAIEDYLQFETPRHLMKLVADLL